MSQQDKIIKMLRANKKYGVANYRFPEARILRYSSRIAELRRDGYNILCERQVLNGKHTGVFIYKLIEDNKEEMEYEPLPKSRFFTNAMRLFR